MDPSYKTADKSKKLNPYNLQTKISNLFANYSLTHPYTYDEILFILDQKCDQGKCDRDVARELFDQSSNSDNKASLKEIIFKYVENLQTSKLCLIRESSNRQRIEDKLGGLKNRKKSYVYLKLIQATVHARYSSIPSFSYKIEPSNIPPVTIVNSLNPVLNHEYTLQMETNHFKIIFYESGIMIQEWNWPDCEEAEKEGEYHRNIMAENISFQLKIKYSPIDSHQHRAALMDEKLNTEQSEALQKTAFGKLCEFEPFLDPALVDRRKATQHHKGTSTFQLTESLFQCLPFLRSHVRNLYYMLIFLIFIECLASISWSMEFIDIALAFGAIAMLYDQGELDLGMEMLLTIMGLVLLIIKSIWGAVMNQQNRSHFLVFLIIAIVTKAFTILLAWIVSIRKEEVPQQRKEVFYDGVDPKIHERMVEEAHPEEDLNIYYN